MRKFIVITLALSLLLSLVGCDETTTDETNLPEVSIENVVATQDSITFEVNVKDTDSVGLLTSVELYQGETLVESLTDLTVGEFTGLLSDTAYTVKVNYVYDLNDGDGDQTIEVTSSISTVAKEVPIVTVDDVSSTFDSIVFSVIIDDKDGVNKSNVIEVYDGEQLISSMPDRAPNQMENIEVDGLLSDREYIVKVLSTYDLNDGLGEQTNLETYNVSTIAKEEPVVSIESVVVTQETITFELNITDIDTVGSLTSIELYQGDTLVESLTDLTIREFPGLLSNNEYTLKATYTYDLNDGLEEQTEAAIYSVSTLAKALPVVEITNVTPQKETITFELNITDIDTVGLLTSIELYQGETLIESLTDLTIREFSGLLSNNEYTLKATYTYDLNDGVGEQIFTITNIITTTLFNGFGTDELPYQIDNVNDFFNIQYLPESYYILNNDLDFIDIDEFPSFTFTGVFNGNDKNFVNLSFNFDDDTFINFKGLFSVNLGEIRNINIIAANYTYSGTSLIDFGIISSNNYSIIENVFVELNISITTYSSTIFGGITSNNSGQIIDSSVHLNADVTSASESVVGGLVGENNGTIITSFSNIDISNTSVASTAYSGGIVGKTNSGMIMDVYSVGDVYANSTSNEYSYAGGITGIAKTRSVIEISNTYFEGDIEAESASYRANAGGISGQTYSTHGGIITIENSISFANVTSNGDSDFRAGGITGDIRTYSSTVITINNFVDTSYIFTNTNGSIISSVDLSYMGIDELSETLDLAFFTETLLWSIEEWDFSGVDSENNIYPKLN